MRRVRCPLYDDWIQIIWTKDRDDEGRPLCEAPNPETEAKRRGTLDLNVGFAPLPPEPVNRLLRHPGKPLRQRQQRLAQPCHMLLDLDPGRPYAASVALPRRLIAFSNGRSPSP